MRILIIGDGCALTTGFSQVIRRVATGLVANGHTVAQITSLDELPQHFIDGQELAELIQAKSESYHDLGVTPYFPEADVVGFTVLSRTVEHFRPDRIFMNCDPGMGMNWLIRLQKLGVTAPITWYAPVEGGPPNRQFCEAFAAVGCETIMYTEWSSQAVEEVCGLKLPWVWHGVDLDVWKPLPADERASVRDALGWTGKFVVAYVARNCARKAQDVAVKAMAQIKRTVPEALLYLHCKSFDGYWMGGWDLGWMVQQHSVEDVVQFSNIGAAAKGEPAIGLARKIAAADLYIHPAQIEGFGLPLVEAMASGLPVVTIEDQGNMAEVVGDAPLGTVPPDNWQTWFTGAELAITTPDQWAQAVYWARQNPEQMALASERSLWRAKAFSWDVMTERLVTAVEDAGTREPVGIVV